MDQQKKVVKEKYIIESSPKHTEVWGRHFRECDSIDECRREINNKTAWHKKHNAYRIVKVTVTEEVVG